MVSLDQVLLLEKKVESAVAKIAQLTAENDALRSKCAELTNALSAKTEQFSSFQTDQNKIEAGILKALEQLETVENAVLTTENTVASNAFEEESQPELTEKTETVEEEAVQEEVAEETVNEQKEVIQPETTENVVSEEPAESAEQPVTEETAEAQEEEILEEIPQQEENIDADVQISEVNEATADGSTESEQGQDKPELFDIF